MTLRLLSRFALPTLLYVLVLGANSARSEGVETEGVINSTGWSGLWTTGIDAAVSHPNGKAYFFKGNRYQRYDFAADKVDREGVINSTGWSGVWTTGIDAAVNHPNGKVYFFKGNRYQRYDFGADKVDKEGVINSTGWSGLWTTGIDAAVSHPNGKAYFFKGNRYQRYDFGADKVDKEGVINVDGWPGVWTTGIDAAVNHPNGKVYFFKGGQYMRFSFGDVKPAPSPSPGEVDLSKTPIAQTLIDRLRDLGQGNERSAGIDYLILNKSTGEAKGDVWVRSRQVSGYLHNPINGEDVPIVDYDWTVTATFDFSIKGNADCKVDFGRGIVMNCKDIATILAAAE